MKSLYALCLLLVLIFFCSSEAAYRKPKKSRQYTQRSTANDLLVRHWNTTNDKINSLDGNLQNHANESAVISLSKAPDGYVVFIKLQKTCSIYHPPKEWFSQEEINIMKENGIGPDEIVVQFEGPSLQTKIAISQNFCNEYYALFQVPLSGNYNLKVYRLRRHYEASREQDKFPKMIYEEFLNVFAQIASHTPQPCEDPTQLMASGYWVSRWNRMTPTPINIKQKCAGGKDERRGLRLTTSVLTSADYGTERCARDIDLYDWNRKICTPDYVSRTDIFGEEVNEHRPNVTDTRPKDNKLIGKKILFVGDSHMRGLADLFLYHTCHFAIPHINWNQTRAPLDPEDKIQPTGAYLEISFRTKAADAFKQNCNFPSNDPRCQLFDRGCTDMTFAYLGAMYCQPSIAKYAANFDIVVLNCGHLPASAAHFTYMNYQTSVANLMKKFRDDDILAHSQVLWLENTAQPLRQDKYTFEYKDWRTYHRLIMFDAIAKAQIQDVNVPISIIPAFFSTLALFDKMCDCGHYDTSAKFPQLLALLDTVYKSNFVARRSTSKVKPSPTHGVSTLSASTPHAAKAAHNA